MKKLLVLFCSAGVLFMAGCGNDKVTPEDVGKKYMQTRFAGAEANLTELSYTVVDAGDDMATVSIEGNITYKEQIFLKKKNGKWMVTEDAPEAVSEVAETEVEEGAQAEPADETHSDSAEAHAAAEEGAHH